MSNKKLIDFLKPNKVKVLIALTLIIICPILFIILPDLLDDYLLRIVGLPYYLIELPCALFDFITVIVIMLLTGSLKEFFTGNPLPFFIRIIIIVSMLIYNYFISCLIYFLYQKHKEKKTRKQKRNVQSIKKKVK